MGVGGHSYGAFSTVNALTLTPCFKAGIAGDGMYNRSLTPFGFQSERRNFFEAEQTYLDMSPFYRADKISGALLMYHSLEDQNVGTAPISSIRMFHALQGLGQAGGAVHVSVRRPQRRDVPDRPGPVGAVVRVVRHVREEPQTRSQNAAVRQMAADDWPPTAKSPQL